MISATLFFVTTGKIKCFGCGKTGHLIRNPPGETEAQPGSSWSEQADLIPNNIPAATVSSDSMSSVSLTDK